MAKIQLVKNTEGFMVPLLDEDADRINRLAVGEIVDASVHFYRHPKFHRKFMAMMRFAYDQYCDSVDDERQLPFDNFRKDITKLAGFARVFTDVDGNTVVEADSISFEKMEQDEFERVYEACSKVILGHILKNWKREDLDQAVEKADEFIVGFMT